MKRLYTVTATALAGLGLLLGGCAPDRNPAPTGGHPDQGAAVEVDAGLDVDAQALVALGYDDADVTVVPVADPAPAPSASGRDRDARRERRAGRVMLRRNTLHGEAVVQTKDGPRTVVVQRGAVTAVNGDTFTVTSTDGFVLSWTFGPEAKIVKERVRVGKDQIKAGDQVGVAGARSGEQNVARLVVVPKPK